MSAGKWTKGPWHTERWRDRLVLMGEGTVLCDSCFPDNSDVIANFNLLAAAPEMAEALEALVEFWQHGTPVHPGSDAANDAIAALRKARGEA